MKLKRMLALVSVTGILASMLSGTAVSQVASQKGASSTQYKTHLTISIAHWEIGQAFTGKSDAVLSAMEKKFNVTITPMNITWDDYKTKLNTWAVSGTLPDVFSDDAYQETGTFPKWVSGGVIRALPTNLDAYPNIKKYMNQADIKDYKYPYASKTAKYYCVPRATYKTMDWWANDNCLMIRKDWMKKVGITKVPTNMKEFTTLMNAFVNKDPDGDGKNDTIGLTAYSATDLYYFFQGYEPAVNTLTKTKSGSWTAGFMTNNALKGIAALKNLFNAGGLDKDIATLKGDAGLDKFTTGVAGAYCHSGYPTTLIGLSEAMKKTYGKNWKFSNNVVLMKPFKATDGKYYRNILPSAWSETYFSSKCSTAKMERALAILNWGFTTSSEGFKLVRYGIKGKDYSEKNGKITLINTKDSSGKVLTLSQKYPSTMMGNWWGWFQDFSYTNTASTDPDIQKMAKTLLDWEMKNCKAVPTNLTLNYLNYDGKDKMVFSLKDEINKALMSDNAVNEWKQMVTNYKANGYTTALANLNKLAKKYKITGYTEK